MSTLFSRLPSGHSIARTSAGSSCSVSLCATLWCAGVRYGLSLKETPRARKPPHMHLRKTHCQAWGLVRLLQSMPPPPRLRPLLRKVGNIHNPSTQPLSECHSSRHAHRSVSVCYIDHESAPPFSAQTTRAMPRIPPVLLNWQTFAIMVVRRNTFRPAMTTHAATCIRRLWI